ncbi:hypothetical protein [Cetobacterium sp.]|uniref:hypothetical protein n=1 Tax=Cetobacterium sp. TaxID=2071632 RepID=UPI003F3FE465
MHDIEETDLDKVIKCYEESIEALEKEILKFQEAIKDRKKDLSACLDLKKLGKDWDIFLQKVEEEITPKIIDETQMKVVDNKYLEKLLGMSEKQASEKIKSDGFIHRTIKRDGEDFWVTQDIREDRVNLTISNNKVIEAHRG